MGILSVEHNRINLDDVNFDDHDLMTCHNRLQQQKVFKKNKHRINLCRTASYKMVGLVHDRRQEKEIKPFLIDKSSIKLLLLFQLN